MGVVCRWLSGNDSDKETKKIFLAEKSNVCVAFFLSFLKMNHEFSAFSYAKVMLYRVKPLRNWAAARGRNTQGQPES